MLQGKVKGMGGRSEEVMEKSETYQSKTNVERVNGGEQ